MSRELPKSLNICFIAKRFPILGRAADHGFLWPIAKGLTACGHKVSVLSWKNPQAKREIDQDNVKAYFLGEIFARNERDFPFLVKEKFQQLHSREPFHIVHSIDANGIEIGKEHKKFRVAMMYDIEATEMSQLYSILAMAQDNPGSLIRAGAAVVYKFLSTYFAKDRKLLSTADGMFVTSPQQKLLLERHYLYPDLKTFVIPYGLEVGELSPREKNEELKQSLKLPPNAQTIVTNTDMNEFSEIKNLLHAFEKVAIKKPNTRLIIVGNGPVYKQVEFEMLNLALGSRVIFVGSVKNSELPDYISLADVYVDLSSRTSGFEPSLIEAMVQKKVIIGSELSPISTIVENGKNGFLIRPADVSMLAKLFMKIFTDEVPNDEIGEKAHLKVMNIFNTQKMVELTLKAYKETLENTGYYGAWLKKLVNNMVH
ncbi:MAG: glycosyltransferase family 4 protein [Bdellovibrionales bacterium]|nr:glycosyltransferase family 4 protein [Bdellovibrionales bacterium]